MRHAVARVAIATHCSPLDVLDWPGDLFDAMLWALEGELPDAPDTDPLAALKHAAMLAGYGRGNGAREGSEGAP